MSLGGATLHVGALVLAFVASASRDERQYPDLDRFDLHRAPPGLLVVAVHHGLTRVKAPPGCPA
ncbi:hypothetical protein AB3662_08365 [Sorangium cellulosum]|uniref:hypothetical protein n=1 Tax=Sorangium cellulosum TaxID=56 RepID=UPI003D9A76D7